MSKPSTRHVGTRSAEQQDASMEEQDMADIRHRVGIAVSDHRRRLCGEPATARVNRVARLRVKHLPQEISRPMYRHLMSSARSCRTSRKSGVNDNILQYGQCRAGEPSLIRLIHRIALPARSRGGRHSAPPFGGEMGVTLHVEGPARARKPCKGRHVRARRHVWPRPVRRVAALRRSASPEQ